MFSLLQRKFPREDGDEDGDGDEDRDEVGDADTDADADRDGDGDEDGGENENEVVRNTPLCRLSEGPFGQKTSFNAKS